MDSKLLLVKSLTLLYRESQLEGTKEKSNVMVREIVGKIKPSEIGLDTGGEQDIIKGLAQTVLAMCDDPSDHVYDLVEVQQRVRVNTADDVDLYESIAMGLAHPLDEKQLKRVCLNLHRTLRRWQKDEAIAEIISKAAYKCRFERDTFVMADFITEHYNLLEPYMGDDSERHPAIVDEIDLDDVASVATVVKEVQDNASGLGLLKTGFQGLNRMLGGGFRRGEEVVIPALQFQFKTGFSLTLFRQIAMYNEPYMLDPTKKPLLVRISFEDSLAANYKFLCENIYENKHHVKADLTGMSTEDMAVYVRDNLTVTGYTIKMLKINPTEYSYRDLLNKLLSYEADGFEIHLCMIDYLPMLPTTGCTIGALGQDVRDLYRRMRNFCEPRKITLITPHQLSTDAKMKFRDGSNNFVKTLVGGGFYDKCKTVDNEVDLELFVHIEIVNGVSYFTIQRGKHRYGALTPIEHQYIVLPFENIGALRDDINGEEITRKKVGGGKIGANDENPYWEFDEAA